MSSFVFFDLEGTGLDKRNHHRGVGIVSIGAVYAGKQFHQHVIPDCDISPGATNKHGMTKSDVDGRLYLEGRPIDDAVSPTEALVMFRDFLKAVSKDVNVDTVTLVAHNCFGYDMKVLSHHLEKYGVPFDGVVGSFMDTLDLAKSMTDNWAWSNLSLNSLMKEYLGEEQSSVHSALADAEDLERLTRAMAVRAGEERDEFIRSRGRVIKFWKRLRWC